MTTRSLVAHISKDPITKIVVLWLRIDHFQLPPCPEANRLKTTKENKKRNDLGGMRIQLVRTKKKKKKKKKKNELFNFTHPNLKTLIVKNMTFCQIKKVAPKIKKK